MKQLYVLAFISAMIIPVPLATQAQELVINGISNASGCETADGIWFNQVCWQQFDDESLAEEEVENYVFQAIQTAQNLKVKIGDESFRISSNEVGLIESGILAITVLESGDQLRSAVLVLGEESAEVTLYSI